MKIRFFLWAFLATAGIASVNAQMRIGGEEIPNTSAVLDLNPDDNVSAGNATLGLALPRVNLRNSGDAFPLLSHIKGMTVYNPATAGDVKPGVYVNNGTKWLRQADSETAVSFLEQDSIVGNEVVNATSGGGLVRSGGGTTNSPYTLGIANGGVTTDKLADKSVTFEKLTDNTVTEINNRFVFDFNSSMLEEKVINLIRKHEQDSIVGNEVTYATSGGGLIRAGAGTAASPYTLGIASGGVTTDKLANNAVTADKITDNAVTMEKLSSDVVSEIQMHGGGGGGMIAPEQPNSILISDNNHQWIEQEIINYPWQIEIPYNWVQYGQGSGWVDLGYSDEQFSPGLYLITVHLANGGSAASNEMLDYVVLEAGSLVYTMARKRSAAQNTAAVEESCVIFISEHNAQLRLYAHICENGYTYNGNCKVYAMPILKLN